MFLNIRWCYHAAGLEKMIKEGLQDTDEFKHRLEKIKKINKRVHDKNAKKRLKKLIKG